MLVFNLKLNSINMMQRNVFKRLLPLHLRLNSTSSLNIEKLEQETVAVEDETKQEREALIELKRNKSRLKPHDRDVLHNKHSYTEPVMWYQGTLGYMRRLYGRHGEASGVNPAICWPIREELAEKLEYERIAYPYNIKDVAQEARRQRDEKKRLNLERQEEIIHKITKLEEWKRDLMNRIAKKEQEALEARAKKERLIEEVRSHFGYKVDPKDEKFKELLEKKEKEQKKAAKEARKKEREEKMLNKLLAKKSKDSAEVEVEKKSEETQ